MTYRHREPEPWNPHDIADEVMHHHQERPSPGVSIYPNEYDAVEPMAPRDGNINVVWIDGHHGAQALLWPMRLGRGHQA